MRLHTPSPPTVALCFAAALLGAALAYLALYLYP